MITFITHDLVYGFSLEERRILHFHSLVVEYKNDFPRLSSMNCLCFTVTAIFEMTLPFALFIIGLVGMHVGLPGCGGLYLGLLVVGSVLIPLELLYVATALRLASTRKHMFPGHRIASS